MYCEHCGSPDKTKQCRWSWWLPYSEDWKRSGADAPCYCDDYAEQEIKKDNEQAIKILAAILVAIILFIWIVK